MMSAEDILNKAKNVTDEAEVYCSREKDTPVGFESNRLKHIESREFSGIALRVHKNGKTGFSSTSNVNDIDGLIERTLETVEFGSQADWQFPSRQDYDPIDVYDPSVENTSIDEMAGMGQELIDKMRKESSETIWDVSIDKSTSLVEVMNSNGCSMEYKKSGYSMWAEGTLVKEDDMLFVWDGKSQCNKFTDFSSIADSLKEQLHLSNELAEAPEGNIPVIFTPRGVAGILLGSLLTGLNGKTIIEGSSPLSGKIGEQVLHKDLSIEDNPRLPMVSGSRMADDEGIPTKRLNLITNGVVENFLFDLNSASKAKTKTTGSASRSIASLPSPASSVIILKEGSTKYTDMISNIKSGLIIERLLGAGQGNVLGGDFSANVLLGYRIENGQITGRVKDTMISGNVYDVLSNIDSISQESQWVGGSVKSPSMCCRKVSVSKKS